MACMYNIDDRNWRCCLQPMPSSLLLQDGKGNGSKHCWRPSQGSHTSATRSILVMNLR